MTIILTGLIAFYSCHHDLYQIAARQGVTVPAGYTPIAHWDCSRLGDWGELTFSVDGTSYTYRVIVVDYTAPEDLALVQARRIVAEVPFAVALATGFLAQGLVPGQLVFAGEVHQWQ